MSRQHKFTSRTRARKRAVDVVFEADQRGMGRNPDVLRDLLRERKVLTAAQTPLPDYSIEIIAGVADRLSTIDGLIRSYAKVPGLDRVAAVDLAVLRVATWEMLAKGDDVPAVIAIDEAISIVKSLSTEASAGFVNAVLDNIRKEIEAPAWRRDHVGIDQAEPAAEWEYDLHGGGASAVEVIFEDGAKADSLESVDGALEPSSASENDPNIQDLEDEAEPSRDLSNADRRYPTLADISAADLAELDELLDEY
ncbi:transcription antitermination factor NusB [Schaalia suimastitidis]|uniref:transcription antitermination factor NusB n=1 Tax=Schaalia suimastitidis TaxID=121163 RepID=UPI000411DFD7|nr:transcription antitermination factor NusB [Schaalia suimastitidis]